MRSAEMTRRLEVLRTQLQGGYLIMVLLLLGAYLSSPAGATSTGAIVLAALFLSAIAVGVLASVERTSIRVLALAAVAMVFAGTIIARTTDSPSLDATTRAISIVLIAFTLVVVIARILQEERVTMNIVFGALSLYLLLGMGWAIAYTLLDQASETAFSPDGVFTENLGTAAYFSLVTQTTLGFGDVVPTEGIPRMITSLQAVIGQLFLVTTVARLVGLQVAQSGQGTPRSFGDDS